MVKDVVDPVADEKLARFVVGSHRRSHPARAEEAAEAARVEAETSSDIISQVRPSARPPRQPSCLPVGLPERGSWPCYVLFRADTLLVCLCHCRPHCHMQACVASSSILSIIQ